MAAISPFPIKAIPVCNLLLSLFALFLGGLPETDAAQPDRDRGVEYVFQDDVESPIAPMVDRPRWLRATRSENTVIRGQDPGGVYTTPPMTAPPGSSYPGYQPVSPFQAGPDPVLPFLNDPGPTVLSGINGPQPQRLGFTPFFDGVYITPSTAKKPGQGHFDVQEYDAALRHVSMLGSDWIFSNTLQGGARIWNGPSQPNLPGSVYRVGWDFVLNSPQAGPWSFQLGFNPSINSDFHSALGNESLNFDGSGTAFYRASPRLLLVLGVQYWDRVDNIIIPNAGIVWNPTERLELRLLFPKSRISYFLGNIGNGSHWLYATGEYHVESYQVHMPGMSEREQIQLRDYRVGVGLRSDHPTYDKYIEVGYIFDRQAQYLRSTPGFNIGDGIMARFGIRF